MAARIIVLNGGSSSGKSSIARCLQSLLLPDPWLTFGVDDLMEAMPQAFWGSSAGIVVASDGQMAVSPLIRDLSSAWWVGMAAMARAGVPLILDEVLLTGGVAQSRLRLVLEGIPVLWVGVRCDPVVAAQREAARGDREPGMAVSQAHLVHRGVEYDVEVDTTHVSSRDCAQRIIDRMVAHPD